MGDKKTLAMARKELEDMYVGVPDDSVNLSFQELAQVMNKKKLSPSSTMVAISESGPSEKSISISPTPALDKLPSLDFNRALQQASLNNHHNHNHNPNPNPNPNPNLNRQIDHTASHHRLHLHQIDHTTPHHLHQIDHTTPHNLHHHQHHVDVHSHHSQHRGTGFRPSPAMEQRSFTYDDMSHVSGISTASYGQQRGRGGGGGGGERRRRPGIPHSNICTVCSTCTYIFRHRCLVCGRVYCRQCVAIGMGEMAEGRKCIDCLGRRFSQRYISKAGNVGCCLGYPSTVKQQELKWAEKGPRTSGETIYGHHRSMVAPAPRPPTPTSHHSNPPSFVATSPYSHNSHHFMPL